MLHCLRVMGPGRMWATAKAQGRLYNRLALFIFVDMVWCALRYGAGQTDYKALQFARMPGWRRATFVTRGVNNRYIQQLNKREDYYKLADKPTFNALFSAYIGRAWLNLKDADAAAFAAFIRQYPVLIVKPTDALCGNGIEKIVTSPETDASALYAQLCAKSQFLVEECIIQHPDMAALYPHSVNTIRLKTIRNRDGVHFVAQILRTGAGGVVVDNTDAGGLYIYVSDAGTVKTVGVNYRGETFTHHPDTNAPLTGFTIPFYAEAKALVDRAARVLPGIRYVGWDVAITPAGPAIIEANHNPAHTGLQNLVFMGEGEPGLKKEIDKMIKIKD